MPRRDYQQRQQHFARLVRGLILVVCASCVVAARSSQWLRLQPSQVKGDSSETGKLKDKLKWLATVVEGSNTEVGNRSARYDSYKYENYRFEGCRIGWRETHESSADGKFLFKEISDFMFPLKSLSQASVRVDQIGAPAYVVSFTTLELKEVIPAQVRTTYEDGNVDDSGRLASGSGIYFQNGDVAKRVAKALIFSIKSCQRGDQASE
jgi:hypothetical protein